MCRSNTFSVTRHKRLFFNHLRQTSTVTQPAAITSMFDPTLVTPRLGGTCRAHGMHTQAGKYKEIDGHARQRHMAL
jgi:hypothetical protein